MLFDLRGSFHSMQRFVLLQKPPKSQFKQNPTYVVFESQRRYIGLIFERI